MTTLIAVYNSDGCIGRCDAKCYDAKGPRCECVCGGRNHGRGRQAAVENVRQLFPEMWAEWQVQHPESVGAVSYAQLPLEAP